MLPENNKEGNQEQWRLLAPRSLINNRSFSPGTGPRSGSTLCSPSLPSSPTSPAACKLYTCKYKLSLLETVIGGCYLPTFREPAMNCNVGLKGEFLNSENGRHRTFPGGDSKTVISVFLRALAPAVNTPHYLPRFV